MSSESKRNIYKGHRYVPKIMGEWDVQETYEGLSIVTYQGTSYTSKKRVPVGVDILDTDYWVVTGNYNAQVENYRQEVRDMGDYVDGEVNDLTNYVNNEVENKANQVDLDETNQQLAQTQSLRGMNVTLPLVDGLTPLKADGVTDNTSYYNSMLNYASLNNISLYFPKGEYLINPLEVDTIPSNTHIHFDYGAVIKIINTNYTHYQILNIRDVENVSITGSPTIIGDRDVNQSITGEWGHGISIRGSKNVYIEQPTVRNCWGDGIYIGGTTSNIYSENVKIVRPVCDNNRRQGLSIVSVKGLRVISPIFKNTRGTAPETGIDIEPNNNNEYLQDIVIDSPRFENNKFAGLHVYLNHYDESENPIDIKVINAFNIGGDHGYNLTCRGSVKGKITIDSPTTTNTNGAGIRLRDYNINGPKLIIDNYEIINANEVVRGQPRYDSGVVIFREQLTDDENVGNIYLKEGSVIDTREVKQTERSIYIHTNIGKEIYIIDPKRLDSSVTMINNLRSQINITDKYGILRREARANGFVENSNTLKEHYVEENVDRRLTLRDHPIGTTITFINKSNRFFYVTLEEEDHRIYLDEQIVQSAVSQRRGSILTLEKMFDNYWVATQQLGDWVREES